MPYADDMQESQCNQKNATSSESRHGRQNSSKLMSPLRFWHRLWYECPEFMSCICMFGLEEITFRNEEHQEFPKLKHVFNRTASGEFTKTAPNLPRGHRVGSFEHCILRVPRKIFTSFRCEVCSCAAVHLMLPGDPHPETTRISNMPRIQKSIAATASKKQQTMSLHPPALKIILNSSKSMALSPHLGADFRTPELQK